MSKLKNALELDMQRNIIGGSPEELHAAIRNAAGCPGAIANICSAIRKICSMLPLARA